MKYILNEKEFEEYQRSLESKALIKNCKERAIEWLKINGCTTKSGYCDDCPIAIFPQIGSGKCFAGGSSAFSK